jgi:hypothetical protein
MIWTMESKTNQQWIDSGGIQTLEIMMWFEEIFVYEEAGGL